MFYKIEGTCIVSNQTRHAFNIVAATHHTATYITYPKQIEKEIIEAKETTEKEHAGLPLVPIFSGRPDCPDFVPIFRDL